MSLNSQLALKSQDGYGKDKQGPAATDKTTSMAVEQTTASQDWHLLRLQLYT